MARLVAAVVLLLAGGGQASAEQIRVMSAGAVEPGLVAAIAGFERSSGHRVIVTFGTGPQLTARLAAGEAADVLIAPAAVMNGAVSERRVDAGSRVTIGRVGVGVVVRRGAEVPDVSSPDALRRAVVAATMVVFNRASTGQYIEKLVAQLGIADEVAAKAVRVDTGEAVMERIAAGRGNEIGFGATTEIRMLESIGVRLVGPLPAAVQNFTSYDAAIMAGAAQGPAGTQLIQFLRSPAGRVVMSDAGVDPAP